MFLLAVLAAATKLTLPVILLHMEFQHSHGELYLHLWGLVLGATNPQLTLGIRALQHQRGHGYHVKSVHVKIVFLVTIVFH